MKAKFCVAIFIYGLSASFVNAQTVKTPDCIWAKTAVATLGSGGTDAYSMATDGSNNIYITGTFDCGTLTFGNISLTGSGVFLAKYDSSGNALWAKCTAGGNGSGIATDVDGNVYVTGTFTDTITFGTIKLTSPTFPNSNSSVFIVKYSPSGRALWARQGYCFRGCAGYGITTDGNNNVYATGSFVKDSISFGNVTARGVGAFLVKYDSTGSVLWAKSSVVTGGTPGAIGNGIATDNSGNLFAVGSFYGDTITFGSVKLINTNPSFGSGEIDQMFVVKYDNSGNVLWANVANIDQLSYQSFNGMPRGGVNGLTTDSKGNLYVTGGFYGTPSTFGTLNLMDNALSSTADIFIVKYNPSGKVVWAKKEGGDFDNVGIGISADNNDNIYVTGAFNSDTIYFGNTALRGTSDENVFIAKYDSSGNVLQALTAGGPSFPQLDFGGAIKTTLNGSVYVTGIYSDSITFDKHLLYSPNQTIFLDKFNGITTTGIKQISVNSIDISVYPNPTSNKLCVNISSSIGDISTWRLGITDELGRIIFTEPTLRYSNIIDLSHYANGIYFVTVINKTGQSVLSVVKGN